MKKIFKNTSSLLIFASSAIILNFDNLPEWHLW